MDIIQTQKSIWNNEIWNKFLEFPSLNTWNALPGDVYFEPQLVNNRLSDYTVDEFEEKATVKINGNPFYWVPGKISMIGPRSIQVTFRVEGNFYAKIFNNEDCIIHENFIMRIMSRQYHFEKTKLRRDKLKRILCLD